MFAEKVLDFYTNLDFTDPLPEGIRVMNPYKNNEIREILKQFYFKFYSDSKKRKLIAGINPGRLGAGSTGIPFTDTKRLEEKCGITGVSFTTHEPSSVFVYEVIDAFGGPEKFYKDFYINSVSPLGLLQKNKRGNWVNCNYYDSAAIYESVKPFMIESLKKQIDFGLDTSVCISFGKKNADFLKKINKEEKFFEKIVVLPHPRYIIQYKTKEKASYIELYLKTLG